FPEDLFQVALGGASTAVSLAGTADVLLFSGSATGGREAARAATERLKPVLLEFGGKHPMVVLKDAPLERAAKAAVWGRCANCGQLHVGVERVYVEEELYPAFCEAVDKETRALRQRMDGGFDTDLGRLIHPRQLQIAVSHLQDARDRGARVVGGEVLD